MNYTEAIALARMEALDALVGALQRVKDDPAETRRIALAIFSAPDPDEAIDRALDEPPPTRVAHEPSEPSPEQGEAPSIVAPSHPSEHPTRPTPPQPDAPDAPAPNPSLRAPLVANATIRPAPTATGQLVVLRNTPAQRLLAHSGRAP